MNKLFSGRSPVTCLNGCASSSQPLVSDVGVEILKKGGNAADAAVAMAAAINVTEPCSTGLGGDAFCLFYCAKDHKVYAMNASGRSPAKLTMELLNDRGFNEATGYPKASALAITVPGAAAGWVDCWKKFGGNLSLKEILQPAIKIATQGFPVAGPITSSYWEKGSSRLASKISTYGCDLLKEEANEDGSISFRPPVHGEVFKNPNLARVLVELAEKEKDGFYNSWISDSIVEAVQKFEGVVEKEDLQSVETTFENPISINYKGLTIWETAPNSQGIVALVALNILKNFDVKSMSPDSPEYWHLIIEALKLAFADGSEYCADPSKVAVPISGLLNSEYGKERAKLINMDAASPLPTKGAPFQYGSDTVYFTVVDSEKNCCSFINSIFESFGSGIIPKGCGFSLQNRGANFSLQPGHVNVVAPNKRPYHTIIPSMVTDAVTGDLVMGFGVMGGFMQPQGHVQVLLNCVEFGMNPQQALDFPRIRISPEGGSTLIEEGMPFRILEALKRKGHDIIIENGSAFGKGQIIALKEFWRENSKSDAGVIWAGCDRRSDGIAAGY